MSKFQRKLAEKMGEDKMTISVKDWDKSEAERDALKRDNIRIMEGTVKLEKERDELKERKQEWKDESDRWYKDFNESQQELQALKDFLKDETKGATHPDELSHDFIQSLNYILNEKPK